MPVIMSIDPGISGGIAYQDREGNVFTVPMPKGMTGQADFLRTLAVENPGIECIIESVGKHFPGNSAVATATFSRHAGNLEACLYCFGIPTSQVSPQKWMKVVGPFPKDKKERKNAIKEKMARLYPHLRVTLKVSDALGILTYAMGTEC